MRLISRVIAVLGLTLSGCVTANFHLKPVPHCLDGLPPQLLIDPRCPEGICGYSCLPTRWKDWVVV